MHYKDCVPFCARLQSQLKPNGADRRSWEYCKRDPWLAERNRPSFELNHMKHSEWNGRSMPFPCSNWCNDSVASYRSYLLIGWNYYFRHHRRRQSTSFHLSPFFYFYFHFYFYFPPQFYWDCEATIPCVYTKRSDRINIKCFAPMNSLLCTLELGEDEDENMKISHRKHTHTHIHAYLHSHTNAKKKNERKKRRLSCTECGEGGSSKRLGLFGCCWWASKGDS